MRRIIGLGNALIDLLVILKDDNSLDNMKLAKGSMQLISASKFQDLNKIISSMEVSQTTGGSAANTIQALASLGSPVGFIGKIGNDAYGSFFEQTFKAKGVHTNLIHDNNLPSGVASTFISQDGERTFGTFLGAAAELSASEILTEMYLGYDILYIEGYLVQNHDLILNAVKLAKEMGLKVCIDMASYNIVSEDLDFFTYLVTNFIDIVFANEEEAYAFARTTDATEALNYIAELCEIAVVKVGSNGSYLKSINQTYPICVYQKHCVIDTTGAGDYYAVGFFYGYINGFDLETSANIGALLSGYIIQVIGTALPTETWDKIKWEIAELTKK